MNLIPLSEIASAVNAILPASFTDEMRKSVQIAVLSTIRKMNLVTREEVEEQEKTLLQLREKIEAMEELTTQLQRQIENKA
jgi:BMFP domain-containing protein YqiC|tara:strand:+ start:244 stop:486 length:243 start_codon:yes stop_codon:yes gene_type:complete